MNIDLRPRRLLILASAMLLAFSAVTQAEPPPYADHVDNARRASGDGHYEAASRAFEEAAKTSSPPFTAEFLLSAAEAAQKSGDPARAERLCAQIPSGSLDAYQMSRLQVVRSATLSAAAMTAATPIAVTPESPIPVPSPSAPPAGIALILPLSGPLAATAEAVRDGFLAAALKNAHRLPIRLYDSGDSTASGLTAYQQALREGASFVVGPLRKESIAAIAALGAPQAPVLALNYLDDSARSPNNFFQLGLAPEDEAIAAAEHAVAQGHKRAIALVPQTEWGDRVLVAFDKRLRELGGVTLKTARYKPGTTDYGKIMPNLMGIDTSKSDAEQRRREDIDFIFMPARASDSRMIWPQFRFHRGNGLPIYATSMIYEGSYDKELSGVRFCDMPMMLQADSTWASARNDAADLPSIKHQPRLYALGYDAYNLVGLLQSGRLQTGTAIPSATGNLQMKSNGAVSRSLGCAQFRDGGIRPLDGSALAQ